MIVQDCHRNLSARFDDPIPLPDGGELTTLLDAGRYIAALPAKIQRPPEWQAEAETLLLVVERGGPPCWHGSG